MTMTTGLIKADFAFFQLPKNLHPEKANLVLAYVLNALFRYTLDIQHIYLYVCDFKNKEVPINL